jgi:hypothetical protein
LLLVLWGSNQKQKLHPDWKAFLLSFSSFNISSLTFMSNPFGVDFYIQCEVRV